MIGIINSYTAKLDSQIISFPVKRARACWWLSRLQACVVLDVQGLSPGQITNIVSVKYFTSYYCITPLCNSVLSVL